MNSNRFLRVCSIYDNLSCRLLFIGIIPCIFCLPPRIFFYCSRRTILIILHLLYFNQFTMLVFLKNGNKSAFTVIFVICSFKECERSDKHIDLPILLILLLRQKTMLSVIGKPHSTIITFIKHLKIPIHVVMIRESLRSMPFEVFTHNIPFQIRTFFDVLEIV